MRSARRARGWGSWLRLVVPDPGVRKMVRLVALDEVMPVHASVTGAIAAAREAAMASGRRLTYEPAISRTLQPGDGDVMGRERLHETEDR